MNWKKLRILMFGTIILLASMLLLELHAGIYPGPVTFKAGTNWRPNSIWKGGLNTTYTLGQDYNFISINYADLAFRTLTPDGEYWLNCTSGANAQVLLITWFDLAGTRLTITGTGIFEFDLYVLAKGPPRAVIGADSYTYYPATSTLHFRAICASPTNVSIYWGYYYNLHGVYNETTGLLTTIGAYTTAYYTDGTAPTTFLVNGSYLFGSLSELSWFHFELGSVDREYWISPDDVGSDIYIFTDALTNYTIKFQDFAGILGSNPYIEAQYYINGTLMTVEKRKIDADKKVMFGLVMGRKYTLKIVDGTSYIWGELLMTDETTVTLNMKGIDFPQDVILAYQYVRIYASRESTAPNSTITLTYQDTLNKTIGVNVVIKYNNMSEVYNSTIVANSFVLTWTGAQNDTDYIVQAVISHLEFGTLTYRQYCPRHYSSSPWSLAFLGTLGFDTSIIIPLFLIVFAYGCFSAINAFLGAFVGTLTASVLAYIGWIAIPATFIVVAFAFTVLLGISFYRRGLRLY